MAAANDLKIANIDTALSPAIHRVLVILPRAWAIVRPLENKACNTIIDLLVHNNTVVLGAHTEKEFGRLWLLAVSFVFFDLPNQGQISRHQTILAS